MNDCYAAKNELRNFSIKTLLENKALIEQAFLHDDKAFIEIL